ERLRRPGGSGLPGGESPPARSAARRHPGRQAVSESLGGRRHRPRSLVGWTALLVPGPLAEDGLDGARRPEPRGGGRAGALLRPPAGRRHGRAAPGADRPGPARSGAPRRRRGRFPAHGGATGAWGRPARGLGGPAVAATAPLPPVRRAGRPRLGVRVWRDRARSGAASGGATSP